MKIFKWIILIILLTLVIMLTVVQVKSCKASAAEINSTGIYNYERIAPYLLDFMNGNTNEVGFEYYFNEQINQYTLKQNLLLFDTSGQEIRVNNRNNINIYANIYTSLQDNNGRYYLALIDIQEIQFLQNDNGQIYLLIPDCRNYSLADVFGLQENGIQHNILRISELNSILKTPYNIGQNFKYTTQIEYYDALPILYDITVRELNDDNSTKYYYNSYSLSFDSNERIGEIYNQAKNNNTVETSIEFIRAEQNITVSVDRLKFIKEARLPSTALYYTDLTMLNTPVVTNTLTPLYATNYTVPVYYGDAAYYGDGINTPIFAPTIFNMEIILTPLDNLYGLDISNQLYDIFTNMDIYNSFMTSLDKSYITITGTDTPHRVGQAYTGNQIKISNNMYMGFTWGPAIDNLVSLPGTSSQDLTAAYNRGFASGKNEGYNEGRLAGEQTINPDTINYISGFTSGYYEGLAQIDNNENTIGSYGFLATLLGILSIEILPNFSIASILTIVTAFAILTLIIKLTRGS